MQFSYFYEPDLWWHVDPILLELDLTMDSRKVVNIGKATHLLDSLALIGGFKEIILLVFAVFGQYFASIFFIQSVSREMYQIKKQKLKPQIV